nr:hypothetical protein [Tanacetum cinerariifolium]
MSQDILTVGSTMRIPLLYQGEYSQWVEWFMNYLEEQTDGEAMINSIKNIDQPIPRVTQVSIAGTSSTEQPPLKDKSMWSLRHFHHYHHRWDERRMVDQRRMRKKWKTDLFSCHSPFESFALVERQEDT